MFHVYPGEEKGGPLRECNKTATSEPNLTAVQRIPPKEVRSESNLSTRVSPMKENISQGMFFLLILL